MDVRAMEFAENSFDAVIDKGTFDSVVVIKIWYSVEKDLTQMPVKCWQRCIVFSDRMECMSWYLLEIHNRGWIISAESSSSGEYGSINY